MGKYLGLFTAINIMLFTATVGLMFNERPEPADTLPELTVNDSIKTVTIVYPSNVLTAHIGHVNKYATMCGE